MAAPIPDRLNGIGCQVRIVGIPVAHPVAECWADRR